MDINIMVKLKNEIIIMNNNCNIPQLPNEIINYILMLNKYNDKQIYYDKCKYWLLNQVKELEDIEYWIWSKENFKEINKYYVWGNKISFYKGVFNEVLVDINK